MEVLSVAFGIGFGCCIEVFSLSLSFTVCCFEFGGWFHFGRACLGVQIFFTCAMI